MLAEELLILNADDALWQAAQPLLDAVLCLEQNNDEYTWRGWQKSQIHAFLNTLPSPCSLVVGVWDTFCVTNTQAAQDKLVLGIVCEIAQGVVASVCTFEKLVAGGLKPVDTLEIGMEDALEIMHYARKQVAPVAWALFIEKAAWDEWLFASGNNGGALNKGELLGRLARAGRCVLMGSQAPPHEHKEG